MEEEWLTITEIAKVMGVDKKVVGRWVKRSGFPEGREGVRRGRVRMEYPLTKVRLWCLDERLPRKDFK
jgi:hypothetical protein